MLSTVNGNSISEDNIVPVPLSMPHKGKAKQCTSESQGHAVSPVLHHGIGRMC